MICGRLADKVSAKIFVPGCLVFQMLVMGSYMLVKSPTGWGCYTLAVFQNGSGLAVIVSMFSYLQKRIPKMIRGMTIAVVAVSGCVGSIIYLQVEKALSKGGTNSRAAFSAMLYIDAINLIFLLICIKCGWYGDED